MSVRMDKVVKNKKTVDDENETPAPAPEAAPDESTELKAQAAKAAEYWDRYLRLTADFDNYKKPCPSPTRIC
jgi:molecular chaperone GrpE (heat shock protein)